MTRGAAPIPSLPKSCPTSNHDHQHKQLHISNKRYLYTNTQTHTPWAHRHRLQGPGLTAQACACQHPALLPPPRKRLRFRPKAQAAPPCPATVHQPAVGGRGRMSHAAGKKVSGGVEQCAYVFRTNPALWPSHWPPSADQPACSGWRGVPKRPGGAGPGWT